MAAAAVGRGVGRLPLYQLRGRSKVRRQRLEQANRRWGVADVVGVRAAAAVRVPAVVTRRQLRQLPRWWLN